MLINCVDERSACKTGEIGKRKYDGSETPMPISVLYCVRCVLYKFLMRLKMAKSA